MRVHSKFIKDLSDKSGISMRQLEAEWKIAERQLDFDILMEPNKWSRLKTLDGTKAEEIARRVEKNVSQPENASPEEQEVIPGEEPIPGEEATPPGVEPTQELGPEAEQVAQATPEVGTTPVAQPQPPEQPGVATPPGAEAFAAEPEKKEEKPEIKKI